LVIKFGVGIDVLILALVIKLGFFDLVGVCVQLGVDLFAALDHGVGVVDGQFAEVDKVGVVFNFFDVFQSRSPVIFSFKLEFAWFTIIATWSTTASVSISLSSLVCVLPVILGAAVRHSSSSNAFWK